jgi:hypothetical protein
MSTGSPPSVLAHHQRRSGCSPKHIKDYERTTHLPAKRPKTQKKLMFQCIETNSV